jgi:hypothetical protein
VTLEFSGVLVDVRLDQDGLLVNRKHLSKRLSEGGSAYEPIGPLRVMK